MAVHCSSESTTTGRGHFRTLRISDGPLETLLPALLPGQVKTRDLNLKIWCSLKKQGVRVNAIVSLSVNISWWISGIVIESIVRAGKIHWPYRKARACVLGCRTERPYESWRDSWINAFRYGNFSNPSMSGTVSLSNAFNSSSRSRL